MKLNIFVDCHVFDGAFQGSTSYLRGLYLELIQQENITFFLASNNPEDLQRIFGSPANVVYLKYRFKNKYLRLLIDIPSLVKKHHIDFAHFQYIVAPLKRCKYIVTTHDVMFLDFPEYFPKDFKMKNEFLFRWSAKQSEIVLTVSAYSKERIQAQFGLQNVVITHNAVDDVFLIPRQKVDAQAYIYKKFGVKDFFLFVSRFEPRKNHVTLLKVFAENQHYKTRNLVFIGNEALECKEFDRYYRQLSAEVQSTIKILRRIDFNDLIFFTKAADLSVYPSLAEGFGIPPLESLACETPTICSNTTAMSDFDFLNGFLFDPTNESEMNDKIHLALAHEDWSEAKEKMLAKYNWKKSAAAFLGALYNQL